MELQVNSSMIPIVKDWKSLCAFENTPEVSSSSSSSAPSTSSFECVDLITFLNKSDLESLLTLYNDTSVTDPSFAFASSVSSSISGSSFLSSSSDSSSSSFASRKYVPALVVQIIWSIVFGVMILVAMVGNLTVIWIVTGHRKMRTVTNVFLLNLTFADLIMATFNGVFNFVYMLHSHWPFGQTYCKINNFIANVTVASSVFTITATSIDRYIAVVHPLKPRMTKHRVMLIIIMVWSLAALLSLPNLLYSELFTYPSVDGGYRVVCMLAWPDGYAGQSTLDYLYNLTFLAITYVIPMISLVITYSLMSRVLWGSKGIGEETDIQRESIRSKQKVARMLIALVVLFAICWLPYHAYFLYTYHYPHVNESVIIQHVYLFSYWLAMSNSMYNPLVYYWMNKRFRSYFASIFCFLSRNRLKGQSSYNVKTDLSSNGFHQHGATTHYANRRATVQSSNQIELHQRNNLDDPEETSCNSNSNNQTAKNYPESKLNLNKTSSIKQSNGYLLQSSSLSPLILNNNLRPSKEMLIVNANNNNSNNNNNMSNSNGQTNGNPLITNQSIVNNNHHHNIHYNPNNLKMHGAHLECTSRLLSC